MKLIRLLNTYDMWIIFITVCMLSISLVLISSAGAAVALSHNWSTFFFTKKHLFFSFFSIILCILCCFMPSNENIPNQNNSNPLKKLGNITLICGIIGVICTFFFGTAIKGAYRWLNIFGLSIQPSEIMKFGCIIHISHLINEEEYLKSILISLLCAGLLLTQPDFGSLILLCTVILIIAFINGLKWIYIFCSMLFLLLIACFAYLTLPHVFKRVDTFLQLNQTTSNTYKHNESNSNKDNKKIDKYGSSYQIIKATQAFKAGGLLGKGPGEGILKYYLPDAHADFIFAVAGEEFGLLGNIFIIMLYIILLFRIFIHGKNIMAKNIIHNQQNNIEINKLNINRLVNENQTIQAINYSIYQGEKKQNLTLLLITGLGSHMLLQAWFNFLSNLSLIPTKGFTLPIIGYGGSGLAVSMCSIGILLNLTRKKEEQGILKKFD